MPKHRILNKNEQYKDIKSQEQSKTTMEIQYL